MRFIYSILIVCFSWLLLLITSSVNAQNKIKVACIGNSITAGSGLKGAETQSYPGQLQQLLGPGYEVMNFGVSGRTAMKTENAYTKTAKYKSALSSSPDIVFIKLGTNDSRLPFRLTIDNFQTDYTKIVRSFRDIPNRPRVILLLPVASYLTDTTRQTNEAITKFILPRIRQVAFEEKVEIIDLHAITLTHAGLFPDQLHPNAEGASLIAKRLYEYLTTKSNAVFDIFKKIEGPYTVSSFHGYDCADFKFEGRTAKIVKPRIVAANKPWIWRARFWGHEPQTDIALLDRGFHVVYCDVSELFGNKEALSIWNNFYRFLRKSKLSKKAVLEGMSRGGVYVYNWAAENPRKVAAVYADAPVLDMKSWPGGKGRGPGSASDWEIFKKIYGYKSEEETETFKNNPLDKIRQIVKGRYPMLHVVGDDDEVVPVEENTTPFEEKITKAGGTIKVIHKPGIRHHPHSLPDPTPIVDFILGAVNN